MKKVGSTSRRPALHVPLFSPPVLGSSLILLFEENEASSLVAFIAELVPEKMVVLNKSTAATPTTSKTLKIRVNRAQCFFVHLYFPVGRLEIKIRTFSKPPQRPLKSQSPY